MTPRWLAPLLVAPLLACDSSPAEPDAEPDAPDVPVETVDDALADAPVEDAADEAADEAAEEADAALPGWQPPVAWREPIADYIAAVQSDMGLDLDEFDHALKELEVFDDRLYLGYGDWTQNTGRTVGMSIRFFDDPDGEVAREFAIEEESIDYYRVFDDVLFIPGVDAAEDALIGNVYVKPSGGTWTKVRSLEQNLHVIDVFAHAGALFASGGGCDDMDHYYANDDQGLVYRSDDGGYDWSIDFEWHDGDPAAVVRYEFFAGVAGNLYVFGNTINATSGILTNVPRRWDDGAWTPVTLLPSAWVLRSHQLDPDVAVVRGVDLSRGTFRAWTVRAAENARAVGRFDSAGVVPVDFFSVADDDMLVLVREGNAYPDSTAPPFTWHVWRTADASAFEELFAFTSDESFACLALWRDAVYLGAASGAIWRSTYVP